MKMTITAASIKTAALLSVLSTASASDAIFEKSVAKRYARDFVDDRENVPALLLLLWAFHD